MRRWLDELLVAADLDEPLVGLILVHVVDDNDKVLGVGNEAQRLGDGGGGIGYRVLQRDVARVNGAEAEDPSEVVVDLALRVRVDFIGRVLIRETLSVV